MPFEGRTDEKGHYRISGHTATSSFLGYTVTAFPPADSGYIPKTAQHDKGWPAGAKFLEKNLTLARGRILHGAVMNTDTKQPAAGVSIVYQPKRGNPHARDDYDMRNRVLTDKDGKFSITGLAGEGLLVAEGPSPDFKRVTVSAGESLYDREMFPHGFARVDVPEKGEAPTATIELSKGVTIEARIVRHDGSAVPWINAACRHMNAKQIDRWPNAERFENGLFRFRGADPSMTYRVFFIQPDLHLGAVADLKFTGKSLEIRLEPTASVRGKLIDVDGAVPRGYQAYALLLMTKEEGKLTKFDWFANDKIVIYDNILNGSFQRNPGADGSFLVENLIPNTKLYISGGAGQAGARVPVILKPGEVKDVGTLKLEKMEEP